MTERSKEELHGLIKSHLKDVDYTEKKMFGGVAFFINKNMFTGTHRSDLFLRLSADDREEALAHDNITVFEPLKGKVMSEYIVLNDSVLDESPRLKLLIKKSISYVTTLPPKEPKKKK